MSTLIDPIDPNFDYPLIPGPQRWDKPHKDDDALDVRVEGDRLHIGPVSITFQRTLRIPDDGGSYPLPPGLGNFPIRRVADYADKVPASWREHGGVFLPMLQREAMWMSFRGQSWRPNALKVGVGKVNALSGKPWSETLTAERDGKQDYMVVPEQPWLDGINAGGSQIKQFVAMAMGQGYTVEGQVTGEETHGGIQLCVFEPKAGKFPDQPPAQRRSRLRSGSLAGGSAFYTASITSNSAQCLARAPKAAFDGAEMGLAGGGRMEQKIYADKHGVDTWDQDKHARVFVHIVNSQMWREITGEAAPESPVSARTYSQHGLPWFSLYDEDKARIAASEELDKVKSVKEHDADLGFKPQQDDDTVKVPGSQVKKLPGTTTAASKPGQVDDGRW